MGYAQRGMAQARQQRPCLSSCMRGGRAGRGCAPRALAAVAGAVGYLHGWREAVRRATSQKRRAALARRCRALPPCGDGLPGCDYPRETVGRRGETGPACGLRQLNQTGGAAGDWRKGAKGRGRGEMGGGGAVGRCGFRPRGQRKRCKGYNS